MCARTAFPGICLGLVVLVIGALVAAPAATAQDERICGGIAGLPCGDGQFCKLAPGECCCDFFGVCTNIPQACPLVYDPVCGCDGKTYGNACEADAAGVSVDHRGQCQRRCGGIAGIPCDDGEFCRLPEGQCCCDIEGVCAPLPQACPDVYDPVCGCDGRTYGNACEAAAAGVSIDHRGPCADPHEVRRVHFGGDGSMVWAPLPDALGYNVYKKVLRERPPKDFGNCLYSDVPVPTVPIPGKPRPGELWLLEVTALFREGEGPMGHGSDGTERKPAAPCTCTLPADPGPCDAAIPRWYHDFFSDACEMFVYGGCGGNRNNFPTKEACAASCTAPCVLPPDPGECLAAIPRWFFSGDTGRCWRFTWGGCGGNANNFESFDKCQDACLCSLPADTGPCDGAFPRWYYETRSASCEMFSWGGCGGNANNFLLEPDCQRACTDVCSLPADAGPCLAFFPRWFFNDRSGRCERFVWGGCAGNGNNFETLGDCEARCPSVGPP